MHYLDWAPAGTATLSTYVVGLLLIMAAWVVGTIVVEVGVLAVGGSAVQTPAGQLAVTTATFLAGMIAVPWVVRGRLRRPAWSVAAGWWPGPLRQVLVGAAISLAAAVAVDLLSTPFIPLQRAAFDPGAWLPLAGISLVGLGVQAGFEEVLFRGYLMQAVASRTGRAAWVIGIPAVLFALPHWGNLAPYGSDPLQLVPYLLMGLTYGWAAWRSGSLWLPLGLHWANNVYATLLIASAGDVLPTGAPLVRDLAAHPVGVLIGLTAASCLLQVGAVAFIRPSPQVRRRWR
jgi:hypothetical protein